MAGENRVAGQAPDSMGGTFLDRAIYSVFPAWGAKRIAMRFSFDLARKRADKFARQYEAADTSSRTRGSRWLTSGLSPDSGLEYDLQGMREHANELRRNDPWVAGALETRTHNIIGKGMSPQSRIRETEGVITAEAAEKVRSQLETIFERWALLVKFYELQRIVQSTWDDDGDVFLLFSDVGTADKPVPLHVEAISADRVETPPFKVSDPNCRLGVQYDDAGKQITGYWVRSARPNDERRPEERYKLYQLRDKQDGLTRICHVLDRRYPGQLRGLPLITPATTLLRDLKDYFEAERIGAQVAACFTAFVKTKNPHAAAVGASTDTNSLGQRIEELEPGRVTYLGEGDGVDFPNMTRPGATFGPFMEWCLRGVSAAISMSYELLTKSWRGTTYSSGRLSLIGDRIGFGVRREQHSECWLFDLWRRFVRECVILGLVDVDPRVYEAHPEVFEAHVWQGQGWPWIDPVKEVGASADAIAGGLSTHEKELGERGQDWQDTFHQLSREQKLAKELGIEFGTPGEKAKAKAGEGSRGDAETRGKKNMGADDLSEELELLAWGIEGEGTLIGTNYH
jgi:lambda family phage portal protein